MISAIPDNAFKSRERHRGTDYDLDSDDVKSASPKQIQKYRIFLTKEVTEIQKLLNNKNQHEEAIERLKELIRQIQRFTFEDYTVVDGSQFTQSQVIAGVESIIYKIN